MASTIFIIASGFSSITKYDIRILAPLVLVGCVIIMMMGRRLNVMSFGEEEAKTMGAKNETSYPVIESKTTGIVLISTRLNHHSILRVIMSMTSKARKRSLPRLIMTG